MFSIRAMCRVLEVSASGYYAWRRRIMSVRTREDEKLHRRIRTIHDRSRQTYGAPRIHAELQDEGTRVGRKTSGSSDEGIGTGRSEPAESRTITTRRDRSARPAPDLVDRHVHGRASRTSCGLPISRTFRRGRAFSIWPSCSTCGAERSSAGRWPRTWERRSSRPRWTWPSLNDHRPNVIHHSDQGCQYTSIEFGKRCREAGVRPSMGSVGDCYDNAMCESFFATLECELIDRSTFRNHDEASDAIFDFIEGFYNTHRRHSALSYDSPVQFEKRHAVRAA